MTEVDECPDEGAFVRIAAGTLSSDERIALLDHVDGCLTCHELLAGVLRGSASAANQETLVGDRPMRPTRPEPGTEIDHYVVVDFLGAGAMGEVLRARDTVLGREVALKLLGRMPGPKWGDRLVREAQAMARMSHPNVVTVYGVGEYDAGGGETIFYVAMELVEGTTATAWVEDKHSWVDVLGMYVAAGEGLAAAHERGIVHRDFKPDNVLVGNDGRARVGDFGLAAAMGAELEELHTESDDALSIDLTRTGELLGTPRFMAPEQLRGAPLDHRADQFAFAVSLYRGLYGAYPYKGKTITELLRAYKKPPVAPPSGNETPAAVWTALRRALQTQRRERFGDMNELLTELREVLGRKKRTRAVVASVAVGVIGLGGGIAATELTQERPCDRVGEGITATWNEQRRSDLQEALGEDGLEVFDRVARRLDKFSAGWQQAASELCRATHVQRVQSEEALQVRMRCLELQRGRIAATLDVLERRPEPRVVQRAIPTLDLLVAPADCRTLASLSVARPDGTEATDDLNRLFALESLGLYVEARELGEDLLERVVRPETRSEVLLSLGRVYSAIAEGQRANEAFRDAARHAADAKNDSVVARAWVYRAWESIRRQRYDEAAIQLEASRVAMRRGDESRGMEYQLAKAAAKLHQVSGELDLALLESEKALAAADDAQSPLARATTLAIRAEILVGMGRHEEAAADAESQVEIYVDELGENHHDTHLARHNLGTILLNSNHIDEAREHIAAARDGFRTLLGEENLGFVNAASGLVIIDGMLGEHERAIEGGKAVLDLLERIDEPDAENGIYVRNAMAQAYRALRRYDEAEKTITEAIAIQERILGTEHPALAVALIGRGEIRKMRGSTELALADYERALKLSPEGSIDSAYAKTGLGQCKLTLGESAEGRRLLEEALELHRSVRSNPQNIEKLEQLLRDLD